jgi:hypothetical protein
VLQRFLRNTGAHLVVLEEKDIQTATNLFQPDNELTSTFGFWDTEKIICIGVHTAVCVF